MGCCRTLLYPELQSRCLGLLLVLAVLKLHSIPEPQLPRIWTTGTIGPGPTTVVFRLSVAIA